MAYFEKEIFNNKYDGKLCLQIGIYNVVSDLKLIKNTLIHCKDCRISYLDIDFLIHESG